MISSRPGLGLSHKIAAGYIVNVQFYCYSLSSLHSTVISQKADLGSPLCEAGNVSVVFSKSAHPWADSNLAAAGLERHLHTPFICLN